MLRRVSPHHITSHHISCYIISYNVSQSVYISGCVSLHVLLSQSQVWLVWARADGDSLSLDLSNRKAPRIHENDNFLPRGPSAGQPLSGGKDAAVPRDRIPPPASDNLDTSEVAVNGDIPILDAAGLPYREDVALLLRGKDTKLVIMQMLLMNGWLAVVTELLVIIYNVGDLMIQ